MGHISRWLPGHQQMLFPPPSLERTLWQSHHQKSWPVPHVTLEPGVLRSVLWLSPNALKTETIAKKKNLCSGLFISKIHQSHLLFLENKEAEVASPSTEVSVQKGECWVLPALLLTFQTSSVEAKDSLKWQLSLCWDNYWSWVSLVNCQSRSGKEMLLSMGYWILSL